MEYRIVWENCSRCDGTGIMTESGRCPKCGGSGTTKGFFGLNVCSRCGGNGEGTFERRCEDCDGEGRYQTKEEYERPEVGYRG